MKKYVLFASAISVAVVAVCIKHSQQTSAKKQTTATVAIHSPSQQPGNTPHAFAPQFSALNISEKDRQHFSINPKASQLIVGKSGTIVMIPGNAFRSKAGKEISGKVKLELVEGISRDDIIKMNLGTMSDQGPLETGGMVCIHAFSQEGDTLALEKGKALDVEIPAQHVKTGMKLWQGIVQNDGSISWTNPQPLNDGLREIPLQNVQSDSAKAEKKPVVLQQTKGGKKKKAFRWWEGDGLVESWSVMNGDTSIRFADHDTEDSSLVLTSNNATGMSDVVDLADEKFQGTTISTAEFRSRLPFIRQACDTRIIKCYTGFPKRELWKDDAAAADTLDKTSCPLAGLFRAFAKQKLGNVDAKDANTTAAMDAARDLAIKNYSRRVNRDKRIFNTSSYCGAYTFGMKQLGWANVDVLAFNPGASEMRTMFFNAHVTGANTTDNVQTTLLVPSRNIYICGYKRPNGDYSFTHGEQEQEAPYPAGVDAYILSRAGSGLNFKFALKKIKLGDANVETVELRSGTEDDLVRALGNAPSDPSADDQLVDDWYTRSLKSGGGCLCGMK